MKRLISLLLMLCFVVSNAAIASADIESSEDLPFVERAAHMYNSSLQKSVLGGIDGYMHVFVEFND